MSELFLQVVNASISAAWAVLIVLILRVVLRKMPKGTICALWALVGMRMLLPFSLKTAFSLMPNRESITLPPTGGGVQIDSGIPVIDNTLQPLMPPSTGTITPTVSPWDWAGQVWLLGVLLMLLYGLCSMLRVAGQVRISAPAGKGIRICDDIPSPFIFGIFRPVIYLPSRLTEAEAECILAHERAHLKRRDHWWKPLGFVLLTVHWFNPVLWVAYILLCRDIEQACDERVLKNMDEAGVKAYTRTLLRCSINRRTIAFCPLAFGENNVKQRIRHALDYKKPTLWVLIAAAVLCVVVAAVFLTEHRTIKAENTELLHGQAEVLSTAILDHYADRNTVREAAFEAHKILRVKKTKWETTVYLAVMYREYAWRDGELETVRVEMSPMVMNLRRVTGQTGVWFVADDCQTRRVEESQREAVRRLLPKELWAKGNPVKYEKELKADCDAQAAVYAGTLGTAEVPLYALYRTGSYYVQFRGDGTFCASFDGHFGDYLPEEQRFEGEPQFTGTYQRQHQTVRFDMDGGGYFTAGLTADGLVFNPKKYGPVPDDRLLHQEGHLLHDVVLVPFTPTAPNLPEPGLPYHPTPFLSVKYDIDGDGQPESVALHHHGAEVGVASEWIRVTGNGGEEFIGAFDTYGTCLSMTVTAEGIVIQMALGVSGEGPEEWRPYHTIRWENGRCELYNGNRKLPHYSGPATP